MYNQLEIREIKKEEKKISFDFFIDGKALSEQIGINRFDLTFSDFDLDLIEIDKIAFPDYDRKKLNKKVVSQFLGSTQPSNQFNSNRIVLYRCHCGSDYCGVISFNLEIQNDAVIWKEITYENDDFEYQEVAGNKSINPIKELKFSKQEYEQIFENYVKKYCP